MERADLTCISVECGTQYLTTKEAMKHVHLGKDTFRKQIKEKNEVVRARVGNKDLYLLTSLDSWLAKQQEITPEAAEDWRKLNKEGYR